MQSPNRANVDGLLCCLRFPKSLSWGLLFPGCAPLQRGRGASSLSLQLPAYSVKVRQSGWLAAVCEEQKPAEFRVGAGIGMGRFPIFLPGLST